VKNIADSLSHLLSETWKTSETSETEEYLRRIVDESVLIAMSSDEIERASKKDKECDEIRKCLKTGRWFEINFKEYLAVKSELCALGDLILRGTRIAIPQELHERVLELGHKGHPGIVVMKQRLHSKVWWPNMDRDVEQWCKRCYGCQLVSKPERPEPMVRTELPSRPWEHLAADFMGPLLSGHHLFAVVDYYSRWVEIAIMTTTPNAEKAVEALEKMLMTHGLPNSITTDNRPQFISQYFKQYCEQNGIVHRHTTALWPQANREIERQNRSFLKRLKIAHSEKKNWHDELQKYLFMYRATPQSTKGVNPAELLFGKKLRTKLKQKTKSGTEHTQNWRSSIYETRKEKQIINNI
jgi:transposase InsO family protein